MGTLVFDKLADPIWLRRSPIFVFAADPDCGAGILGFGQSLNGTPRKRADFLALCREIVLDGAVDGCLLSPANAESLAVDERLFETLPVTPFVRLNSETAVWGPRGGNYKNAPSLPFQTVDHEHSPLYPHLKCGLYSLTLVNDACADAHTLEHYLDFARYLADVGHWHHFLEVFLPNVETALNREEQGEFVADSICRILSCLTRQERPIFLKTPFTSARVWRELCEFDPGVVVGALGGPRVGTRETLQLAFDVSQNGGRAILFGRNIIEDTKPVVVCQVLREVLDGKMSVDEAWASYQTA